MFDHLFRSPQDQKQITEQWLRHRNDLHSRCSIDYPLGLQVASSPQRQWQFYEQSYNRTAPLAMLYKKQLEEFKQFVEDYYAAIR